MTYSIGRVKLDRLFIGCKEYGTPVRLAERRRHNCLKLDRLFIGCKEYGTPVRLAERRRHNCLKQLLGEVLMYGWEASKLTKTEAKKLGGFQYKCMKRILRIRWPQTISHQQIQENTGVNRTSDEIRRRRWNWIGHIMRNDKEEHCVTALEWRPEGKRRPDRPKTTWRRMVEDERKTAGWQSWANIRTLAANRSGWKENVKALCALWHKDV